jgi:tripartite-type tricarboxylate transporter receptor subunit TctC
VIVINKPGQASIFASNYLYKDAPKDGTSLGIVSQSIGEAQLSGASGVSFDVGKFDWIGRMASDIVVSYVWHTSRVKNTEDLKSANAIFGGTGPSEPSSIYPGLLNRFAGTNLRVVTGYSGTSDIMLALERGEVEGTTSSLNSIREQRPEWLEKKMVRILVQYGIGRSNDLPDVPTILELGRTQEDKDALRVYAIGSEIGRSLIAPPNLPPQVTETLRAAFAAVMKDPEFQSNAQNLRLDLTPMTGAELQSLVASATNVTASVRERVRGAAAKR